MINQIHDCKLKSLSFKYMHFSKRWINKSVNLAGLIPNLLQIHF